jgi:hypothetical protein
MVIVSGCGVSAPETLRGRKVRVRLAVMPVAVTSLGRLDNWARQSPCGVERDIAGNRGATEEGA